jgi:diguanylate cyclase (GGDEF)-like protein
MTKRMQSPTPPFVGNSRLSVNGSVNPISIFLAHESLKAQKRRLGRFAMPVAEENPAEAPSASTAVTSIAVIRRHRRLSPQARALRLAFWLSLAALMLCSAILIGYVAGFDRLYQPFLNGPATHPFTALALGAITTGTLIRRPLRRSWIATGLYLVALSIGVLRIIEIGSGSHVLEGAGLFSGELERHRLNGFPIVFSWNTAVAIIAASIAGLSQAMRKPLLSQVIAVAALAPPLVSVVGYIYGLRVFYGQMSIYTTLILIDICGAMLLSTSHRAFVRMTLSNYSAGKMARRMLLAVVIVPLAGGLLVVRLADLGSDLPVALLVVLVALGNVAVTVHALMEVEVLDRKRRQHERVSEFEATHDALTMLPNRRLFDFASEHEFARSQRFGSKLSLVMLDVDHFKSVNDKYGHQTGDRVLKAIGRILTDNCREVDIVSRHGGEEFVVLFPDTDLAGAFHCAEKLRCAVSSATQQSAEGAVFAVTVSAGVAERSKTDENIKMILRRADWAMYAAKAAGRDQTCRTPNAA